MSADLAQGQASGLKSHGIALRAALWLGLGAATVAITAVLWFEYKFETIHVAGLQRSANMMANGLAQAVKGDLVLRDYASLEARLQQSMANEDLRAAMIIDNQGQVLSHLRRDRSDGHVSPVFDMTRVALPTVTELSWLSDDGAVSWAPVISGMQVGWVRVEVGDTSTDEALHELQRETGLIALLAFLVMALLLMMVIRRAYVLHKTREDFLQKSQQDLADQAHQDGLTGLPNRRMLMLHLRQAIAASDRRGHALAVCFMDLDGFKQVNDQYGHDAGDDVLGQVARRLEACVRAGETVARLGGDEFVVLLSDFGDLSRCDEILQRLITDIRRPLEVGANSIQIGVSIGVALYPSPGNDVDTLLAHADQAMYLAKRAGKNCWRLHVP